MATVDPREVIAAEPLDKLPPLCELLPAFTEIELEIIAEPHIPSLTTCDAGNNRETNIAAPLDDRREFSRAANEALARRLFALNTASEDESEGHARHVIFSLDDMNYAIPLANMLEIAVPPKITPLPFVTDWLLGITSLRGDIISLVDLRAILGMTPLIISRATRMIVVRSQTDDIRAGFLVDGVRKIRRLDTTNLIAPPAGAERPAAFFRGVGEHDDDAVLAFLDIECLLSSAEMRQFDSFTLPLTV
jgi:purine-binding chemotaxis protein CheW